MREMRERGLRFCSERAWASWAVEALTMGWNEKERKQAGFSRASSSSSRFRPSQRAEESAPNLKSSSSIARPIPACAFRSTGERVKRASCLRQPGEKAARRRGGRRSSTTKQRTQDGPSSSTTTPIEYHKASHSEIPSARRSHSSSQRRPPHPSLVTAQHTARRTPRQTSADSECSCAAERYRCIACVGGRIGREGVQAGPVGGGGVCTSTDGRGGRRAGEAEEGRVATGRTRQGDGCAACRGVDGRDGPVVEAGGGGGRCCGQGRRWEGKACRAGAGMGSRRREGPCCGVRRRLFSSRRCFRSLAREQRRARRPATASRHSTTRLVLNSLLPPPCRHLIKCSS
ncbi:hypothetical protein AAT19DRAFT_10454 [Rhodotorula toruloides]|uniref:Uncharacterized protein n=1 Tax=Rhodotorula toruloides TaxID=5286 RepID=A0A2S9ZYU5_RHOTO|nr:hypothetical protein AAT19DRAFT_10454 [Rhodotorula toruloides]